MGFSFNLLLIVSLPFIGSSYFLPARNTYIMKTSAILVLNPIMPFEGIFLLLFIVGRLVSSMHLVTLGCQYGSPKVSLILTTRLREKCLLQRKNRSNYFVPRSYSISLLSLINSGTSGFFQWQVRHLFSFC